MKKVGIWIFGLIASGVGGGVATVFLVHPLYERQDNWFAIGLIGGVSAFACIRLWTAKISN